jgi:DNA (cytosine-5)-methyltransferase 1
VKVGSLFSGIGGLDLGLERAGMTVVWQSEIDPYACRVLAKHWPHVPNLGDITTIDWSTVEPVDIICGGYPCQPFSLAGVRRGEADPRHLWPHFLAALRHLRPRLALLENVPGHLSLGFGRVLGDLAENGYDAEWTCVSAAAIGAPHLRVRVFVVAYPHGEGEPSVPVDAVARPRFLVPDANGSGLGPDQRHVQPRQSDAARRGPLSKSVSDELRQQSVTVTGRGGEAVAQHDGTDRAVANADGLAGSETGPCERATGTMGEPGAITGTVGCRGARLGETWAVEPDVGRVADGVPARVDRLRCLGNAVVPQVAEWVGRRIIEAAA